MFHKRSYRDKLSYSTQKKKIKSGRLHSGVTFSRGMFYQANYLFSLTAVPFHFLLLFVKQIRQTFARFLSRAYYASSADLATTGVHFSGGADLFCFCAAQGNARELPSWLRHSRRGSTCWPQHNSRAEGGVMRRQKQKSFSK